MGAVFVCVSGIRECFPARPGAFASPRDGRISARRPRMAAVEHRIRIKSYQVNIVPAYFSGYTSALDCPWPFVVSRRWPLFEDSRMRPYIRLGDPTDHGGVVVSASSLTIVEGKPVARIGDMVACPIPGHGVCPIVTGDSTCIVDGSPVARQGDKTACGAGLVPTQFVSGTD